MRRHAVVRCAWDADAAVWYISDSDVPGLATEATSLEALRQKLPGMIQDLLEDDRSEDIEVDLIAYAHDRVRVGAA
jgi:predicted RNase H-like HicB family nuclease